MTPRRLKKLRTTRSDKPRLELTERDYQTLLFIGSLGFLATDQIAKQLFPSFDRCRRRLRLLFDAGFIFFFLQRADKPNLVRLTPKGLKHLIERFPEYDGQIRLPGIIKENEIEKRLLLVDVRIHAVTHGEEKCAPLTHWFSGNTILSNDLGLRERRLFPAAIIEFSPPHGQAFIAVELIEGHTRLNNLWPKRLERYYELAIDEYLDGLWIITTSDKMATELKILVAEANLENFARVFTKIELKQRLNSKAKLLNQGRTVGSNPHNFNNSQPVINSNCLQDEVQHG